MHYTPYLYFPPSIVSPTFESSRTKNPHNGMFGFYMNEVDRHVRVHLLTKFQDRGEESQGGSF